MEQRRSRGAGLEARVDVCAVLEGKVEMGRRMCDASAIAIFSEVIPSWLAVVDRWGCEMIYLFCASEQEGFKEALNLLTPITQIRSAAGMRGKAWMMVQRPVVLIQGSSGFCSELVQGLAGWGLTADDRIALVMSKSSRGLSISFISRRLSHSDFGGVTSHSCTVAITKGWGKSISDLRSLPTPKVERRLSKMIDVTFPGKPFAMPSKTEEDRIFNQRPSQEELVSNPFVVPNVCYATKWVKRRLTIQEIGEALDFPIRVSKHLGSEIASTKSIEPSRWAITPPVKVVQWVGEVLGATLLSEKHNTELIRKQPTDTSIRLERESVGIQYTDEEIYAKIQQTKAVKSDDAQTDFDIWNEKILRRPFLSPALNELDESELLVLKTEHRRKEQLHLFEQLRKLQLRQFRWCVRRSFRRYFKKKYSPERIANFVNSARLKKKDFESELLRDLVAGKAALDKCEAASFWEWDEGSYPLFWRWQPSILRDMRDGTELWKTGPLPTTKERQLMPPDKATAALVEDKLDKVRSKGYITKGLVRCLTHFFSVPKGEDDIRLVYDMSKSRLNDVLWTPKFWMPMIKHVLFSATHKSWFCDVDVAEMFLNFLLDLLVRAHCGVDLSWKLHRQGYLWERWTRMAMGMSPSPWVCTRLLGWMAEIVKGNRRRIESPFGWDSVVVNCPGSPNYDPTMPRLYKWNSHWREIAADMHTFMDDYRLSAANEPMIIQATRILESRMSYLGIQDATRKRREHGQHVGEWAGAISVAVEGVGLFVTVSEKKWLKAKTMIEELMNCFTSETDRPWMNTKELERKTGFLVHLAMTFDDIMPFLRGFYLTLNSWRPDRDRDGWKMNRKKFWRWVQCARRSEKESPTEVEADGIAPELVKASPLLYGHLEVLKDLLNAPSPTLKLIRGLKATMEVAYIFGDASGEGFGSTRCTIPSVGSTTAEFDKVQTHYRLGVWMGEDASEHSNHKEFNHLVLTLESMSRKGELEGRELFVFTDNAVTESIVWKGSTKSSKLFPLVVRLYQLNMKHKCKIHFVHVAGTRMIEQGTDGLSRGNMLEGVMMGDAMLKFVPLHLNALELSEGLKERIRSTFTNIYHESVEFLEPIDWFERGHDIKDWYMTSDGLEIPAYQIGTFVWTPPPALASIALDEIRQARHKRQDSFHVFIVPKLMVPEWRRDVFKAADFVLELPPVLSVWKEGMHETLTLALFFPYLSHSPWELRHSPCLVDLERKLPQVFKRSEGSGWRLLSKLSKFARDCRSVSVRELRRMLQRRWDDELSEELGLQRREWLLQEKERGPEPLSDRQERRLD